MPKEEAMNFQEKNFGLSPIPRRDQKKKTRGKSIEGQRHKKGARVI